MSDDDDFPTLDAMETMDGMDAMSAMSATSAMGAMGAVGSVETADNAPNLDTILGIPVSIQVVLGGASMPVAELIKLTRGAVIQLDHRVGQPVDVVVNGRVVARGEMVVIDEDGSRLGVSLTEIVGQYGAAKAA